MKKRMACLVLLTALLLTAPALADFDQGALDGIIMITSGGRLGCARVFARSVHCRN